ncbi:hypothetical protein BH10PLA2_BH10PLA2_18340 [soil metagenome]
MAFHVRSRLSEIFGKTPSRKPWRRKLGCELLETRVTPTITVTSTANSAEAGTLIAAILQADSQIGGDTIVLPANATFSLNNLNYSAPLSGMGAVNSGLTLLPGITQPITIIGNGSFLKAVTGSNSLTGRFFDITSSLTLNNLNMIGGAAQGGAGGGGFTGGGGGAGLGGSIFVNGTGASLTMNQATIAFSSATCGAGAFYIIVNGGLPPT